MKEKSFLLIMDGSQIALAVLMLVLATWWIGYHLIAGNFNVLGFLVAAFVWGIVFHLTRLSIRDYKKDKKSNV